MLVTKSFSPLSSLSSFISLPVFYVLADKWLTASFLLSSASSFYPLPPPPLSRGGKLQGRVSPGPGSRLAGASYPVIYPELTHPCFVRGCEDLSVKTGWRIIKLLARSCIKVSYEWVMMMVLVVVTNTKGNAEGNDVYVLNPFAPNCNHLCPRERPQTIANCENDVDWTTLHMILTSVCILIQIT